MTYLDCHADFDARSGRITLGNDRIEKCVAVQGACLRTESVRDPKTGALWAGDTPWQHCPVLPDENPCIEFLCRVVEDQPGMAPHLLATLYLTGQRGQVWYTWRIFPQISFVYVQADVMKTDSSHPFPNGGDVLDCIPLGRMHLEEESFRLYDKTDENDVLVRRQTTPLYERGVLEEEGNLFRITDVPSGDTLLLIRHAPTPGSALHRVHTDLRVEGCRCAALMGNGVDFTCLTDEKTPLYASAVGVGTRENILDELWRYNTAMAMGDPSGKLFAMSNTWGDRSQDAAVCEEFLLREIERAHMLGLSAVQIDDGWQTGATINSTGKTDGVWEGYWDAYPDFWEVNQERFPHGLEPIVAKAREYGLEVGLWFSPDSSREFANYQRDIDVLLRLHERCGVRYFKMDGVKIRSKTCEKRFTAILETVTRRSNGRVRFNLDVTSEDRFGYFYQPQYGTLFVENRYTDWGNYFPHRTFRNLWNLCAVIPARRLQMELLNPRRNPLRYQDVPFAPILYAPDYLLGTVLPANPLYWMELSGLAEEDVAVLAPLMRLYRQYQQELFHAQVIPIGQEPNGMHFSGYLCRREDRTGGNLLLFREETVGTGFTFSLPPDGEIRALSVLYQSAPASAKTVERGVHAEFSHPRSFIWLQYRLGGNTPELS